MDDIERRGLPKYLTAYLNYKLGIVNSIPEELYKEVPNGLKECIDCIAEGKEVPDPSILASYPIYFKEEIIEEVEEHSGSKCKTPIASPAGGEVEPGTTITLTCATEDATIYYTTDGSTPTTESTEYTEAILISADTTIKAIAVKEDLEDSSIMSASYTIAEAIYTVAFSELDALLQSLDENNSSNPYKIKVTGLTAADCGDSENSGTLGYVLKQNEYKYVDLTKTELPDDLTSMEKIFYECESLVKSPEIPYGVTNLSQTFDQCWNLNQLPSVIPNSVTTLYRTFAGCSGVSVFPRIPSSVTSMTGANFESCYNYDIIIYCDIEDWTNVEITPEEFLYVESEPSCTLFMYVPSLESKATLVPKLEEWDVSRVWVFSDDPHPDLVVTSYDNLEETLATLYANTISNPYKIKITDLDSDNLSDAFGLFENYKNVIYMDLSETELPNDVTDLSNLFGYFTRMLAAPAIPNSVENLYETFFGCSSLTTPPVIPNSVTNMTDTFGSCSSLVKAPAIPNGVTTLNNAFQGCSSLTDLSAFTIPDGVTSLRNTLYGCV